MRGAAVNAGLNAAQTADSSVRSAGNRARQIVAEGSNGVELAPQNLMPSLSNGPSELNAELNAVLRGKEIVPNVALKAAVSAGQNVAQKGAVIALKGAVSAGQNVAQKGAVIALNVVLTVALKVDPTGLIVAVIDGQALSNAGVIAGPIELTAAVTAAVTADLTDVPIAGQIADLIAALIAGQTVALIVVSAEMATVLA